MALIRCHECGKNVSTNAIQCPHCGTTIIKQNSYHFKSEFAKKALKFAVYIIFPILAAVILWKGKTDIWTLFGILILLTFILIIILSLMELIARAVYYIFTGGKELFPDEKKADD